MGIREEINRIANAKSAIAEAITGKGVTVPEDTKIDGYAALVDMIQQGGGDNPPSPPADGKTRLYITIPANAAEGLPPPRNVVPLYFSQSLSNGVTIDWGDGSTSETVEGSGNVNTSHEYSDAGDYVISLMPDEFTSINLGRNNSAYCVMGNISEAGTAYCSMLKHVVIGKNISSVANYAFQNCGVVTATISNEVEELQNYIFSKCFNLKKIILPNSLKKIGTSPFQYCYNLESLSIPDSVTSMNKGIFQQCYGLTSAEIPGSINTVPHYMFRSCKTLTETKIPQSTTSIGTYAYTDCISLSSMVIPASVISIGVYAFNGCTGMKEYHFLPVTPPSLEALSVFNGISDDCIIYVPTGSLQAYKTATNWVAYSSHIQEEPV